MVTPALATAPCDVNLSLLTDSNLLLAGDYAFNLNDGASVSEYNLNNFVTAAQSVTPIGGNNPVYYKLAGNWYNISAQEGMGSPIAIGSVNSDGKFKYINMNIADIAAVQTVVTTAIETVSGYNAVMGVNKPKLIEGMTPVKWVGAAGSGVETATTEADTDWYDYNGDITSTPGTSGTGNFTATNGQFQLGREQMPPQLIRQQGISK